MKISMKLDYQNMAIFFNFASTSSHRHSLQVENCDSNSRLVVNENNNGKLRFERVNCDHQTIIVYEIPTTSHQQLQLLIMDGTNTRLHSL